MNGEINVCAYPHYEVQQALKAGILERPDRCSECQRIRKPVAHHDDYAKPEEVRWLCRTCHMAWHRANGPGANKHLKKNYEYPKSPRKPRFPKEPKEKRQSEGREGTVMIPVLRIWQDFAPTV